MPFGNPIITGSGFLIRDNIKSSNFVIDTSGWIIRKDGFAQFSNVQIRGSSNLLDLLVTGQLTLSGSLRVTNDSGATGTSINFGNGPYAFFFAPAHSVDYPTQQWAPGSVGVGVNPDPTEQAYLLLGSPKKLLGSSADITLFGSSTDVPTSQAFIQADAVTIIAATTTVNGDMQISGALNSTSATVNGKVPTVNITVSADTSNSGTFTTTETVTDTTTFTPVSGKLYRITWSTMFQSTIAGDIVQLQMREDNLTGVSFGVIREGIPNANASARFIYVGYWLAPSASAKTMVTTAVRGAGTGTLTRMGSSTRPSYLHVEQVS